MTAAGKCGVSAQAVLELLMAMEVPHGSAVYVCGANDGLEPLKTRYQAWTQREVLPPAMLAMYRTHASLLALLDVSVSAHASMFISARGNFDRAVISRRKAATHAPD